jgi:hypothetical protein
MGYQAPFWKQGDLRLTRHYGRIRHLHPAGSNCDSDRKREHLDLVGGILYMGGSESEKEGEKGDTDSPKYRNS